MPHSFCCRPSLALLLGPVVSNIALPPPPVSGAPAFSHPSSICCAAPRRPQATNVENAFMTMASEIKKRMQMDVGGGGGPAQTVTPGQDLTGSKKPDCAC